MRPTLETARLRDDLMALVRKRVPASDAEDVVQSALMEALAAKSAPDENESFRRFAFGVAKNKIADYYRRSRRETFDVPEVAHPPANHEGHSLLTWAEQRLPNAESKQTLDWMLREGDGEKLETIAEDEDVPAPRIRKRVSRLREHLRVHWQKELALLAAMGIASAIIFFFATRKEPNIVEERLPPAPSASPERLEERMAAPLRKQAHEDCQAGRFRECIERLDQAKAMDPAGETMPGVATDRARAEEATRTLPQDIKAPQNQIAPLSTSMPKYAPPNEKRNVEKAPRVAPTPTPTPPTQMQKPGPKSSPTPATPPASKPVAPVQKSSGLSEPPGKDAKEPDYPPSGSVQSVSNAPVQDTPGLSKSPRATKK